MFVSLGSVCVDDKSLMPRDVMAHFTMNEHIANVIWGVSKKGVHTPEDHWVNHPNYVQLIIILSISSMVTWGVLLF